MKWFTHSDNNNNCVRFLKWTQLINQVPMSVGHPNDKFS